MIQNGKVVGIAYELKDSEGETIDQAGRDDPFIYLHGASQIVPGLEEALMGLKEGDKKSVVIQPDQAYGEVNPGLVMTVNKSQFPNAEKIEAGMQFQAQSPEGHGMIFTIAEVNGDQVTIDGNHPLAGEALHFAVEVLSVRDATEEEKSHGHAHGPGGHHHH